MDAFVTTDGEGDLVLDGRPWRYHGVSYFGRRPGTCGADWMGEHWAFNASRLEADFGKMRDLGLNAVGLFIPGRTFYDGTDPVEERFERLDTLLDTLRQHGLRAVVFGARGISAEAWCAAHGVDPGEELWHPAVSEAAERHRIEAMTPFLRRCADRPEVLGWAMGIGRFFRFKFTAPPVRSTWAEWLRERFDGDLGRAGELLALQPDERDWDRIRMPTEMEPYFNEENPRSCEFALMQQMLSRRSTARIAEALRKVAPNQLMIESMEGCCFSTGHLNTIVPEMVAADALWLEAYHWEGPRSYHIQSEEERRWMAEPIADRPSVEVINAAGYVEMLTRWMGRSGKPIIICHGVDIGEERRGVRDERDQLLMFDRYNTFFTACGGRHVNYWCWSDDELSKTYTRKLGFEYTRDTPEEEKGYSQAGETMGVVRCDGSPRPVADRIRGWSRTLGRLPTDRTRPETLVLCPCPVFQSLYRYRANLTVYALLTSLARQGIGADTAMTSAGEHIVRAADLEPYGLVIVGAGEYTRDHPEAPDAMLDYVRGGGTLLLAPGETDRLQDAYLKWRNVPALAALAGCRRMLGREPTPALAQIRTRHESFVADLTPSWRLDMAETAHLTHVEPAEGAEVLVEADGAPLLYRHRQGEGIVYVFTWHLDALLYRGDVMDYRGGHWDWLLGGVARELDLERDMLGPMTQTVREMTYLLPAG
ncbi:MAG: hypothetical protein R6V05_00690 [Candidatus Brocadiia bacterium]